MPTKKGFVTLKYGVWEYFSFLICVFQVWLCSVGNRSVGIFKWWKIKCKQGLCACSLLPWQSTTHTCALITCKSGIPRVPGWAQCHWDDLK